MHPPLISIYRDQKESKSSQDEALEKDDTLEEDDAQDTFRDAAASLTSMCTAPGAIMPPHLCLDPWLHGTPHGVSTRGPAASEGPVVSEGPAVSEGPVASDSLAAVASSGSPFGHLPPLAEVSLTDYTAMFGACQYEHHRCRASIPFFSAPCRWDPVAHCLPLDQHPSSLAQRIHQHAHHSTPLCRARCHSHAHHGRGGGVCTCDHSNNSVKHHSRVLGIAEAAAFRQRHRPQHAQAVGPRWGAAHRPPRRAAAWHCTHRVAWRRVRGLGTVAQTCICA